MANIFPEPTWGTPQEGLEPTSSFCRKAPTPYQITGALIRLLQYHFSDSDNIVNPLLKRYIWSNNKDGCGFGPSSEEEEATQETSGSWILILPSHSSDGSSAQQLPAVLVKREPYLSMMQGMKGQAQPGLNAGGVFEGVANNTIIEGSHSLICKGATGGQAEALAEEVFYRMLHYNQVIKKDLRLGYFYPVQVGDVKDLKNESSTSFYVVVRLQWKLNHNWRLISEAPVVKRIRILYDEK